MWKTHLLYFLSVWFCFMQNCYIYKSKTMNGKPLFDLFVKDLSGKWCRECSVSSFPPQLQKCPFCSESQSHPSWSLYLVYCLPCYQLQPTSSRPQQCAGPTTTEWLRVSPSFLQLTSHPLLVYSLCIGFPVQLVVSMDAHVPVLLQNKGRHSLGPDAVRASSLALVLRLSPNLARSHTQTEGV